MGFLRHQDSPIHPELLVRVTKGDQQAFEQLYEHSSSLLFTLVRRILNDREEASEVLQEVYAEVWRKAVRYDPTRGSPLAWLVTLTRSRAIDCLRAAASKGQHPTAGRGVAPEPRSSAEDPPDQAPGPFEGRADQELRAAVSTALAELPAAQRQALELAYYDGFTHVEIAERLGEPLGTVKIRIKLGLNKLREALRPHWEGS